MIIKFIKNNLNLTFCFVTFKSLLEEGKIMKKSKILLYCIKLSITYWATRCWKNIYFIIKKNKYSFFLSRLYGKKEKGGINTSSNNTLNSFGSLAKFGYYNCFGTNLISHYNILKPISFNQIRYMSSSKRRREDSLDRDITEEDSNKSQNNTNNLLQKQREEELDSSDDEYNESDNASNVSSVEISDETPNKELLLDLINQFKVASIFDKDKADEIDELFFIEEGEDIENYIKDHKKEKSNESTKRLKTEENKIDSDSNIFDDINNNYSSSSNLNNNNSENSDIKKFEFKDFNSKKIDINNNSDFSDKNINYNSIENNNNEDNLKFHYFQLNNKQDDLFNKILFSVLNFIEGILNALIDIISNIF